MIVKDVVTKTKVIVDVNDGLTNASAKLEDLLVADGDSKFMTTGVNGKTIDTTPRLYTLDPEKTISLPSEHHQTD